MTTNKQVNITQAAYRRVQLIVLFICLTLVCVGLFLFSVNTQVKVTPDERIVTKVMPEQQFSTVRLDSFKMNVSKAYTPFIQLSEKHEVLLVSISKNNQLLSDFINQNENVLDYGFPENAFDIKMNKAENSILGQFKIQIRNKSSYVQVPNDILFAMTKKIISQHE